MTETLALEPPGRLLRDCSLLQAAHEDVAPWNMRDPLAAVALLKGRRRLAHKRAEFRAERPEARVTDQHAHLGHGPVGGAQQVLSTLDAVVCEVLGGRLAVRRTEAADEVVLRHPGPLCNDRDIEVIGIAA